MPMTPMPIRFAWCGAGFAHREDGCRTDNVDDADALRKDGVIVKPAARRASCNSSPRACRAAPSRHRWALARAGARPAPAPRGGVVLLQARA